MCLKKFVIFLVLKLLPFAILCANPFGWAIHGSIFYFPADNGVDSDPAPILPSAGYSLSWEIENHFRLEFTQDIYFTNYEFNWTRGHPMAASQPERAAFVLGFVTGVQAVGFWPVGNTTLRVFGGPAADLRIITVAFGLHPELDFTGDEFDARAQARAVSRWFWGSGRWFMPVAGFGADFPINERFLLGFDLRTWLPVYKLWTNDNTSAIDGWRFGVGFRITPRPSE